jgi:hypothetical protein
MAKRQPSKYQNWITDTGLLRLEGWARDGLTDTEIAKKVGVNPATLSVWKAKYPEIEKALSVNADAVDRQVEGALLKRALGYEYEETKQIVEVTPEGDKKQRVEKTIKQVVPDTTAQIFWLKNRKPTEWRDKREMEIAASVGLVQIIDDIPDAEGEKADAD